MQDYSDAVHQHFDPKEQDFLSGGKYVIPLSTKQGYSGNFQFGTGRLTDLKTYQPAQGEDPNGNHWQGTFNIPGFPDVKTHAQFLANPDAQRMAAEVQFKDIGQQIDNTPGAQDYNRAGLAAVAQLGGVHGMQKFVATGGGYNPHDSNGTSLQNYYTKFSQTGLPGLKQSFGHPDGPLPADHPARGVQMASAADTAGMPATATDAAPVSGVGGSPAPGSTVSDTPDQVQAKLAQMRANVSGGAPVQQAAVDPAYAASMQAADPRHGDAGTAGCRSGSARARRKPAGRAAGRLQRYNPEPRVADHS